MENKMKVWVCVGVPDEDNIHYQDHLQEERWECVAESWKEAIGKAAKHWQGIFHEIGAFEKENN